MKKEGFIDFFDENNKKIDTQAMEKEEQDDAEKFIQPTDCVLELGARYGTVSAIINKKLLKPTNHIAVEPDEDVWNALEKNKQNSQSYFRILRGIISNKKFSLQKSGYGTNQIESDLSNLPHFTFKQVQDMVDTPFTALVADCEGCIEHFFKENEEILKTLRIIMLEEDFPEKCNYNSVKELLKKHSFKEVKQGFHCVWTRNV